MKLLAVAGELSGDAHGGPLLQALRERIPGLTARGIGGPRMRAAGLEPLHDFSVLQVHGLVEVLRHLPRLYRVLGDLEREMRRDPPDALLCIDYPGFNLKLAAAARRLGIPVVWYSSPQVWAWRRRRLHTIARVVDRIVVLLPFEAEIYRRAGVDAVFAGHPLVGLEAGPDAVAALHERLGVAPGTPVVGVMPGSRPSELRRNLPPVLEGIGLIRQAGYEARWVLPLAESLDPAEATRMVADSGQPVEIVPGAFLPLLKLADLAIVASGTATLQVGLAGVPFLVVYRVAPLTYRLARALAYVGHIAMINILARREVVPELIQGDLTPRRVRDTFLALARDSERQAAMRRELAGIAESLGPPGAYERGAEAIAEFLRSRPAAHAAG